MPVNPLLKRIRLRRESDFVFDSDVRHKVDSVGIVLGFYGAPLSAFEFMQMKVIALPDFIFVKRLNLETDVGRMHHKDLLLPVFTFQYFFYVIYISNQRLAIRKQ